MGRLQVRSIRDATSVRWLQWLGQGRDPEDEMWPYGQAAFGVCLKKALGVLSLSGLGLSPASLRAGGATAALESGMPLTNLKFGGGWASEKSMSAYLQEAESAATLLDIEPGAAENLYKLLYTYGACRGPPAIPYRFASAPWTLASCSRP